MKLFVGLLLLLPIKHLRAGSGDEANSLLWKVSGNGLQKPTYIFGTIHMICEESYIWSDVMQRSFQQTEELCLELDMDDPKLMNEIAMGLLDKDGKQLKDYFTAEQYAKVSAYVKSKMGMPIGLFATIKPVGLEMMLTSESMKSCDSPIAYEQKLMEKAAAAHREVIGLETVEDQLNALESMPKDSVISDIMEMVSGDENQAREYKELVTAYSKQDLTELRRLIQQQDGGGMMMEDLLENRNKKWAEKLPELMKSKSMFVAVGAGHLPGDGGILNLLRKKGYTVTAVR